MTRQIILTATVLGALVAIGNSASAEKHVTQVNGKELVVHTSPVPVVVHRVFPPYLGKHVSARQLKAGRLPAGSRR